MIFSWYDLVSADGCRDGVADDGRDDDVVDIMKSCLLRAGEC